MTETEAWKFVYEKKLAVPFPAKGTEVCVGRGLKHVGERVPTYLRHVAPAYFGGRGLKRVPKC